MAFESFPSNRLPRPLAETINRVLCIDQLESLYAQTRGPGFVRELLDALEVKIEVAPGDRDKIPATGAVVAVANHPLGILDGVMLADLLTGVRNDVRILTNRLLGDIPEISRLCFFIDTENAGTNGRVLKQAAMHLRSGGMLLIFPAGEVSHFDIRKGMICDPEWNRSAARLIRMTNARSLPILIRGANGLPFQMLGMVHPFLRTAALPAEMLNKRGRSIEIRVGRPIDSSRIESLPDDLEATRFLRLRTELLARRLHTVDSRRTAAEHLPVASEQSTELLRREIEALPPECRMVQETGGMSVYLAGARSIPLALREIGRLREITFRAAGEGTGEAIDLDRFDQNYLHLFLWNRAKSEIVGAYRLGDVPMLLRQAGRKGLYTDSLFRFKPGFLERLKPALELGRSFVRPEYQRQFAPLLLLWKGIVAYVSRHPEYSTLIGAVSVSNQYSAASRELIARYFETRNASTEVRPRRPLHGNLIRRWETAALCSLMSDVEDLAAPIADLELDGKGIPILVKQYAKLGGKLMAFSVDPQFGNTLDGFVLVDLTQTDPQTLSRYMGKEEARRFFAWHAAPQPRVA
ncbi:MAG TPA: GNAT family N-acyltransferase [Bryobacteraceae bacterium]|jgi:putative hemolysin|nr:GNAT family N-acyltransferase [Bryobacteraceae bacterium]